MSEARPRSCASCDQTGCAMNARHGVTDLPQERIAYLLDDVWPEYASMVASLLRPGDQLIAPGIFGKPRIARYAWPGKVEHRATRETAMRHWSMRRVANAPGGVRQRAYLAHDRALAAALARHIDYRARHLVVAQSWLTALDEAGVLGGRSYDVLMTRYPLGEVHRLLDRAAAEAGPSATVADFRAPEELVGREARLLDGARRIVTPHHGIGGLFPAQWIRLAWHRPDTVPERRGDRVAFFGPSLTRNRPDIARRLAETLADPLVVIGDSPDPGAWDGITVEHRRRGPDMFDGVGAILHPATMTIQPRSLLNAFAKGIRLYATPGCGLAPDDYRPIAHFDNDRRRASRNLPQPQVNAV